MVDGVESSIYIECQQGRAPAVTSISLDIVHSPQQGGFDGVAGPVGRLKSGVIVGCMNVWLQSSECKPYSRIFEKVHKFVIGLYS